MSDDSQYIKSIQDFILNIINSQVNEKEKAEYQVKALMRYSLLERILSKLIFRYRSKDYDILNLLLFFKEHTESEGGSDSVFEALRTFFEDVHKELFKIEPLYFYGHLMQEILKFPKKLQENHKDFKDFSQEDALDKVEGFLKDHIELNFFQLRDPLKKIDNQYFNENYVKQATDKLNFDFSICSLKTMFKILERFEEQSLICKDPELLITSEEGMISEKKLYNYLDKSNKEIKFTPKNLVDYFIQSHLARISQYLYEVESTVNNYEIENNICLSLFLNKKIVKDYSFYFDKKPDLEKIFMATKKFKE
jgi:hypothetical protein